MNKVLDMQHITKVFPGVVALDDVTFQVEKGEVRALCGENGAGKSTLIKILAGAIERTKGEIFLNGKEVHITNPHESKMLGISIIYQEFNLNENLSIAENIFLGREPLNKSKVLDWKRMYKEAQDICNNLGFNIDVKTQVKLLSVAQKQMVEIAKSISDNANIIVMDEPSATLTNKEIDILFDAIRKLKEREVTIIYISHRLEEIFKIADSVTVMRDGQMIGTKNIEELDKEEIIRMMVGRELKEFPSFERSRKDKVMEVKNINRENVLRNINFDLYRGEILGLAGLVGAGRTETVRAIMGIDPIDSGDVYLEGKKLKIKHVKHAIKAGIGLVPEDRKGQGLVLGLEICKNISIVNLKNLVRNIFINKKKESIIAKKYINDLKIKTPSENQKVINLSGGNQQKVVLAKWMYSNPKVLIFDEPTRGIDVGAKAEIYNLLNELVDEGIAVIVISSELPEILGICDRILVMHEGEITAELNSQEASQEEILKYAAGLQK